MKTDFNYTLEEEDIHNYSKLSAKEKLIWLDEITLFTEKALTDQEKTIRDSFLCQE